MTILCIETSTSICSAAICIDGKPAEQCICSEGSNHARLLPRYIEQLLQSAQHNGWTIDAVAVSEGPGSYTGLRIGTSTAKGLCYGLHIPLIPIPTLQIIAAAAVESIADTKALLCPMIDARRMEVYTALYTHSLQSTTPVQAAIVDEHFTEQNGLVNSTMKVVRNKVESYFKTRIDYAYTAEGKMLHNEQNIASLKKLVE